MKVVKSEFIELPIIRNSTADQKTFPDVPNLRNAALMGISAASITQIGKTPLKAIPVNATLFKSAFLVLSVDNSETIKIPMVELELNTSAVRRFFEFAGQKINWSKCYIKLGDTTAISAVQDENFLLTVYYQ